MNQKTKEHGDRIVMIEISSLKPHPLNSTIYTSKRGTEDEELKNSINLNGLLEPLVVDRKSLQIISGHRRFDSIKELEWKEVPVRLVDVDFDIVKLIHFNKYREKTIEEKRNEEREMKSYLKLLPREQRISILNGTPMREYISNEIGISFNSLSRLGYIEEHGEDLLQDIYLGKISPSKAYQLVKSQIENKDYKTESTVIDIRGRIKKLSGKIPKRYWLGVLDEIYGEN